jgi:hypothetical protein
MYRIGLLLLGLATLIPTASHGQNWREFEDLEDRFSVNFPGEPVVEEISYMLEDGMTIPARRYSVRTGEEYYAVTVVDFWGHYDAFATTILGSMAHAATQFRRNADSIEDITYDAYMRVDRIPGHALQIRTPEGGRLYVLIVLHQDENLQARRLYITEAQVSEGVPPPGLFQQSFEVLDSSGQDIRYEADGLTLQE